jgi:hypothetical protein
VETKCSGGTLRFEGLSRREVVARFDGGSISSDGGGLLLREVEARTGILERFARCFRDHRHPAFVEHPLADLLAQRVYALALGYEDLVDHDELRRDPLLAVLVGKRDVLGEKRARDDDRGKALAGKSTLNRLELTPPGEGSASRYKKIEIEPGEVDDLLVEVFLESFDTPPSRLVLDLDATDDPLHGHQEGRFFHGFYGHYCYLPLYVFCGEHLLCARLRPSNLDASKGSVEELERIVGRIREVFPEVEIWIRGDSGFCREEILRWCEEKGVHYVVGFARNPRLEAILEEALLEAETRFEETGEPSRTFRDFPYQTHKTWSRERRVVGKAEVTAKGRNPRFVVTSLTPDRFPAKELYEEIYCARGDMENRIKEQQLYLFADRTSAQTMRANQIRLYLSSVAYLLLHALRRLALAGTEWARAQCHTIRTKLLKIGAQIRVTVRRVSLSLASGYPYAALFEEILDRLRRLPLRRRVALHGGP